MAVTGSLPFKYAILLFLIHGWLVSFLQSVRSVLKINVGCQLYLVAGKVHKRYCWLYLSSVHDIRRQVGV